MAVATRNASSSLLTYEQYMAEKEIYRRYDILDGVRIFMTNPNARHQRIVLRIARHLRLTSEGPQSIKTYAASETCLSVTLPELTFPIAEVFAL
jgi:hypothetical protein